MHYLYAIHLYYDVVTMIMLYFLCQKNQVWSGQMVSANIEIMRLQSQCHSP